MADKQDAKEEITVVGPGADADLPQGGTTDDRAGGAGDDYEYPEGEGGEEGRAAGADERTGHADEGADDEGGLSREQKRRRRKREKYDRDQRELGFLRQRNEQLERDQSRRLAAMESRQTQSDVLAIDSRISQAQDQIREAESLFAQAVKSGDEGSIAEALRVRDELRDGLRQYQGAKQQTVRAAQERQNTTAQPVGPDPAISTRAAEWKRSNSWFDPDLRDEDSRIAYAIEQGVFQEGRLSPATPAYWAEVDRRAARRLPERYRTDGRDDDEDDRDDDRGHRRVNGNGNGQRKPSGPTMKVGGRERVLGKGEVYIDEDRKAAMIEKGIWDDPVLRERQLRYYQQYDREAGRRPR